MGGGKRERESEEEGPSFPRNDTVNVFFGLWLFCGSSVLSSSFFSVKRYTLFFACTENHRNKNTMRHSRVTEQRDGIEVARSEEEKGGECKRREGRREGRGGEASMGQGDERKGSKDVGGDKLDELSRGNRRVSIVAMLESLVR